MAILTTEGSLLGFVGATATTTKGSANSAVTHTIAASSGEHILVHGFEVTVIGAAPGSDMIIEIEDDSTPVWETAVGASAAVGTRTGAMFAKPILISAGNAMNLQVSAGGASCVAVVSTSHTIVPGD